MILNHNLSGNRNKLSVNLALKCFQNITTSKLFSNSLKKTSVFEKRKKVPPTIQLLKLPAALAFEITTIQLSFSCPGFLSIPAPGAGVMLQDKPRMFSCDRVIAFSHRNVDILILTFIASQRNPRKWM